MTTAIEIHTHLLELPAERALASIERLAVDSVYMADLDGEIEATARAYVGSPSPRSRPCAPSSPGHRSGEEMATMTAFATTYVGEPTSRPG